jgi:adenosylcobinamide hydrolase
MRLCTSIESVNAEVDKNKLVIFSKRPLEVLSSAVLNGGFTKANAIISIHVPVHRDENLHRSAEDLDKEIHENPEGLLKKAVVELNLDLEKVVGIMTAADLRNVAVFDQSYKDITLSAFVTAGVDVSATAGETTISKQNFLNGNKAGTINIILLVDGDLTESCMVDAVKTVTEAKTVALKELDIRSNFSGDLASGTVTDSVVVACTKRGKLKEYAGTATVLGELIGKSVKESVKKALQKQGRIRVDRSITQRLEERGISIANAITLFKETCPKIPTSPEEIEQFKEEIQQVLSDPNVVSFVVTGLRLDDDVKMGLIQVGKFNKSRICGILQTAVMNYLDDKNVASKHIKLDDTSLATLDNLGLFTGSILSAIMSAVYSNMGRKN